MNYEIVELAEKTIAGVSAITNNADPQMPAIIGGLWQKLYADCYEKITCKVNGKAIGLYCDYGTPAKDDYTVLVGVEVTQDLVNSEFTSKRIPAGKYAKFTVAGDVATATGACWKEIWSLPLKRTFTGDFEEYQADCNGKSGTIVIYIAIK